MQHSISITDQIHERALTISKRYLAAESELIDILDQAERHRVFLAKGHSSLFQYVIHDLSLSESVAYNLISVMRKSREVPALKTEIRAGNVTLSNARKIVPVLNQENQSEWLEKAATLSQRQLEKEIVKIRPDAAVHERASYVAETRVRLEVGLSEKDMMNLRRVQDLLSQERKSPVSLEEVLITMTGEYLKRNDPVRKAKRQWVKKGLESNVPVKTENRPENPEECPADLIRSPVSLQVSTQELLDSRAQKGDLAQFNLGRSNVSQFKSSREPIPALLLHRVNLRDERRCTHVNESGKRCNQSRWVEIHHKTPVSQGGKNTLENLATLCSAHHAWVHRGE